jgi:hypothetical protein
MGNAGEYIECVSCGGTSGPEVLSYDPVAERLETYALLRRLTVLAMLAANRFGDEHIAALCSTLQQHSGDFVTAGSRPKPGHSAIHRRAASGTPTIDLLVAWPR